MPRKVTKTSEKKVKATPKAKAPARKKPSTRKPSETPAENPPKESSENPPKESCKKALPSVSSALKTLHQRSTEKQPVLPPHLIVKAFAGTGKTFSLMTGVASAFLPEDVFIDEFRKANNKDQSFQIIPSDEQKIIWQAFAESSNCKSVVYCAFNKSIVSEFQRTWGWLSDLLKAKDVSLQFATVNSLGHRAVYEAFGRLNVTDRHTENLLSLAVGRDIYELRRYEPDFVKTTTELVSLCKLNLTGYNPNPLAVKDGPLPAPSPGVVWEFCVANIQDHELDELVAHYDLELNGQRSRIYDFVRAILGQSLDVQRNREIDFNDQNWLPVVLNLPVSKQDLILIDEGQDLPRVRQEFCRRLGKRVVLVGDMHQAIYGFAGADVDSIPRMQTLLGNDPNGVREATLTVTRRCAKAVVKEAQAYVPTFTAHESNLDGSVSSVRRAKFQEAVSDGDMVLSRVNAPLVSSALRLIAQGRKAIIRGRNFGDSLQQFVKKMKATDAGDLLKQVDRFIQDEQHKEARKRFPSEAKLIALDDRRHCIEAFCEGSTSVQDVLDKIDLVFAGKVCPRCNRHFKEEQNECYQCRTALVVPEGVQFSSVHRAKGLEARRVFVFQTKDSPIPHPMAKTAWQQGQEKNLLYVAITRAIEELTWIVD